MIDIFNVFRRMSGVMLSKTVTIMYLLYFKFYILHVLKIMHSVPDINKNCSRFKCHKLSNIGSSPQYMKILYKRVD